VNRRVPRIAEPHGRNHGRLVAPTNRDDHADLYDYAYGPRRPQRPLRELADRRPVNEWDDPIIDGLILRLDALAAVEATKARVAAAHAWSTKEKRRTKADNLAGHEHWYSADQVAAIIGVPVQTVRSWRRRGTGPINAQFGTWIRWEPRSVETFARNYNPPRRRPRGFYQPHIVITIGATGVAYWTGVTWTDDHQFAHRYPNEKSAQAHADVLQDGTIEILPAPD
jgi:hypothetical protein